jgi:hypothetical protein
MGSVVEFPKTPRVPDIEFEGSAGFYTVHGRSEAGVRFLLTNLDYESWQGSPRSGIAIEDSLFAQEIAHGALNEGCLVRVNGKEL